MKIHTRYILGNLLGPTIFITLALTCVVWLTQSLRFVDLIVNQNLPISTFLYFVMLLLPSMLSIAMPVAIFCASIYIYNKLLYDSELLVLKAAGVSRFGLAKPLIILGIIITFFGYSISLYLLPVSYQKFKDMQFYLQNNYATMLIEEGVFNTPIRGLTVYVKERGTGNRLKGILVHDNRNKEKPLTYMAEEGIVQTGEDGVRFMLLNASRQEVDRNTGEVNILYFDSYPADISLYTANKKQRRRRKDERFVHELFFPDDVDDQRIKNKLIAEGHERVSWPLYNIILPLLVVGFLQSGDFNRRGQTKQIVVVIIAGVALVLAGVGGKSLAARGNALGIIILYAPILFALIFSIKALISQKRLFSTKKSAIEETK